MQQVFEQLLQMNAHELTQPAIMSVQLNGETYIRPVQSLMMLKEPLVRTETGLCPASFLTQEQLMLPLEEVFSAGQLLFTFDSDDHDDSSLHPDPRVLPDGE